MELTERERFEKEYTAGKDAFERGKYRLAIERLETACNLVPFTAKLGGEARIWLVTTYQAAGKLTEAIVLTRKLCSHPNLEISQQARRLLYIIEAPQLKRPREWMVEMPEDLSSLSEENLLKNLGTNKVKSQPRSDFSEPLDLSATEAENNLFILAAAIAIALILGGLFWFGA